MPRTHRRECVVNPHAGPSSHWMRIFARHVHKWQRTERLQRKRPVPPNSWGDLQLGKQRKKGVWTQKSRCWKEDVRERYVRSATTGKKAGLSRKSGMVTRDGDRPEAWLLYKNLGITPRVRDEPASTNARSEKCANSGQRLPKPSGTRSLKRQGGEDKTSHQSRWKSAKLR